MGSGKAEVATVKWMQCPNCEKATGFKRAFGFGTFVAFLLTLGWWLLAMPFYPQRCIACGMSASDARSAARAEQRAERDERKRKKADLEDARS